MIVDIINANINTESSCIATPLALLTIANIFSAGVARYNVPT